MNKRSIYVKIRGDGIPQIHYCFKDNTIKINACLLTKCNALFFLSIFNTHIKVQLNTICIINPKIFS